MTGFSQKSARIDPVSYGPDDARFVVSDFIGSISTTTSRKRLTRTITDVAGFENTSPSAQHVFSVTCTVAAVIVIKLRYNGLVIRDDTYNDVGTVYVNNVAVQNFTCCIAKQVGSRPVFPARVTVPLAAGVNVIRVVLPYCAGVDFEGIDAPSGVTLNDAPSLVGKRIAFLGDSITHGFNASQTTLHWPSVVARMRGAQQGNLGYGGRVCDPADPAAIQPWAPDAVVSLVGVNNFIAQTPLATFLANHQAYQNNIRAALVAAGKPNAPIIVMTMTWTNFTDTIPVEDYRVRIRTAVTNRADPYTTLIEGATGSMPTTTTYFPDGIHPNDAGSAIIAPIIAAALP